MKHKFFLTSLFLLLPIQICVVFTLSIEGLLEQANAQEETKINNLEYVPPTGRTQRIRSNQSTPNRCARNEEGSITLLVPQAHIPTTISGRPTFFWYAVTKKTDLVKFTLVDQNQEKPIVETQMRAEHSGLFQFTLEKNTPELEIGKQYRWTVTLVRNLKHPSQNLYAFTLIKRVPFPPQLKQKLAAVTGKFDRSTIYANSGIWYDTLSTVYRASNRRTSSQPQQLLEQINSGKFFWLINQLPVASYVRASKDDRQIVEGSSCF